MRRLLHVENDPLVAKAFKRLFRIHGFEVGTVSSYSEGRAVNGHFDLAVMDIDLGDGDGVELAERLLERGVVDQVVFLTARTDAETTRRASRFGPVVSKTAGSDTLLDTLRERLRDTPSASHVRDRVDPNAPPGEQRSAEPPSRSRASRDAVTRLARTR